MASSPAIPVQYTASTTNFSFALFRELGTSVEGNLFASTYSIHLLLLLLTFGSKSKTNDELKSVLHLPKDKPTNYEKLKSIIEYIEDPDYLTVANGIFSDTAFDLSADYENQARNYLMSEVRRLDFTGNPTAGESEINEWTKNKTNGKISKLFGSGTITKDTSLVLASAVHFQNKWKHPFTHTKPSMFCLSAQKHVEIQMMKQTNYFGYYKDARNKFAAVELPYNGGFEMLVILPDKMDGIKELEKSFLGDASRLPALIANLTTHEVILSLPVFSFESDLDLEKTMTNLGCGDMFSTAADFSQMTSSGAGKLKVDEMKHKSFVDVNENGTEAAGITAATLVTYSSVGYLPGVVKTVTFHACHPFLFMIKKGNHIIFMGRLVKPNM